MTGLQTSISIAAISVASLLCAWGARRDLGLPLWVTMAAFALGAACASFALGPTFAPLSALVIACLLIAEADRRHHLIPDAFTLAILALALVMPFEDSLLVGAVGAAILGGAFLLIRQTVSNLRGADALGLGDVKLAAAMGGVLGPYYGFVAVAIAGAATLAVVAVRARGGGVVAVGAPFGVGLATATAAVAIARAVAP